jgi:hypothetical protein
MAKGKPTAKQEKFKNNILEGMDAKVAYLRTGYKAWGSVPNHSKILMCDEVYVDFTENPKCYRVGD